MGHIISIHLLVRKLFRENEAEDDRCLAMAEEAIVAGESNGCPVTGVIVEPIQVFMEYLILFSI